ncbi:MAG: TolC family protein [Candidatus Delongbacteria bacterium]|nr:TolC family protein [Candidatus Delongbacteria bacterium]
MKIILIILLLTNSFIFAEIPEKALTLDDVIAMSRQSLDFKKINISVMELERSNDQLFYYYFPKLEMNTSANYDHYADSSNSSQNTIMGLNLTQNFIFNSKLSATLSGTNLFEEKYNMGKRFSVSLSADIHYKMKLMQEYDTQKRYNMIQKLQVDESAREFYLNVIDRFYSLYRSISQFEIETKGYELSLKHYNEGVAKYKAGIIPEVEMLDLELYLQRKELSLKRSKNALSYAKEDFNRYFNLPLDYEIRVKHALEVVDEYLIDIHSDLEKILNSNPDLLITKYNIENKSDEIIDVHRSKSIKGNIGVSFSTESTNTDYDLNFDENAGTTSYYLGLTIPIFDKGEFFNSLDIAKLNYKLAKEEYRNKEKELENTLRAKVRTLNLNYENLKISKKSFELSEKIYNISQKRFENGLITSKDFIQNQIDYMNNKQDMINSEIDYILMVYEYKKFIGIDLF